MKKLLAVLGVVLFSVSAFALNTETPEDKNCPGKAAFERISTQDNNYFIAQYILINLADPMAKLSDAQALPQAKCYAGYTVKGKRLVDFVRIHAVEFRNKEQKELVTFATRVEALSHKADLEALSAREGEYEIMNYVFSNMLNSFAKLSDDEAAPVAKIYSSIRIKGKPFTEFVEQEAQFYTMDVEIKLDSFAWRVEELSK